MTDLSALIAELDEAETSASPEVFAHILRNHWPTLRAALEQAEKSAVEAMAKWHQAREDMKQLREQARRDALDAERWRAHLNETGGKDAE